MIDPSSPRLLLAASEVPTVGGSSTASYDLFRRMLDRGYDAHYVNLVDEDDVAWYELAVGAGAGNPAGLPNVHLCRLLGPINDPHPELTAVVNAIDPGVMAGFGFIATRLLKAAAPDRRAALVTGTCRQAQDFVTSGRASDAMALQAGFDGGTIAPQFLNGSERRGVDACDLIITHSTLTRDMFTRFFPGAMGKLYPNVISFAEWITAGAAVWQHASRPFAERDIDVLFVASDWDRPEKNYPLLRSVVRTLGDARIHVIGDVPRELPGVVHHGFLPDRADVYALMGRARCVACPSLMDAAPGILFEASVLGSNVVASKNCGNWEMCHPDLVVDPLGVDALRQCLIRAVTRKFDDRLTGQEWFCFDELMMVLAALGSPVTAELQS